MDSSVWSNKIGFDLGYDAGYDQGFNHGYDQGFKKGFDQGFIEGYDQAAPNDWLLEETEEAFMKTMMKEA